MTNFTRVAEMNVAFNNPKGDPHNINWERIEKQCKNILDEYNELMRAIEGIKVLKEQGGHMSPEQVKHYKLKDGQVPFYVQLVEHVRDALCDIHVFGYGAHHLMGYDADRDMDSVVDGVMTRFCRDEEELQATIKHWSEHGITEVYVEGEFPKKVVKSAKDQPDAPKGKFLKSIGYSEPVFYEAPYAADPA